MARLGVSPVFKAYDTDGSVLASGTVETYITGTSTPKSTWDEAAESTENTASFTLDANGEKVIYFETDVAYKLIIKDSLGTTVRTVDPYLPIVNPTADIVNDIDMNGFSVITTAGANLNITPDTTGDLVLDGLKWPQADGTAGYVLKTDGALQLSWVAQSSDILGDTTPQLGGDLDTNTYNIQFDDAKGILDDAGNEQLIFQKTTSAVNYIEITNAATAFSPTIAVAGSDSNIDLNLTPKGTGVVTISGITYPTADGTSGQYLKTDGAALLSFADTPNPAIATQADMEAATSSTVYATPANFYHHPGVAKAWCVFDNAGTILSSYNVTSVADNGTGDFTITWAVTFSSVNFSISGSVENTGDLIMIHNGNPSTTTSTIYSWDLSADAKGETGIVSLSAVAFGDLA